MNSNVSLWLITALLTKILDISMWLVIIGLWQLFLEILWLAVHMSCLWVGVDNIPWPVQFIEVAWFLGESPLDTDSGQKIGGRMDDARHMA